MRELPSLRQLEYFVALAEIGNFRRAAEHCGISQPSLSVQLSQLEKRLGQKLVERARTGVILTPAGRDVNHRARAILEAARDLVNIYDSPTAGLAGTIRFGASATLGPYLLPHAIARLHAKNPELDLFIREGPPGHLVAGLAKGDYDMILVQLPVQGSDLATIRLFREPLELVVARDHPWVGSQPVPREALADQMVLSLSRSYSLRQQVEELCDRFGARLRADYEGTSLDALRLMAGMGMGVTFLPALYVRSIGPGDEDVVVVGLEGPRILRSVGLVVRRSMARSEAIVRIAELIHEIAREVFRDVLILEPLERRRAGDSAEC